MDFKHLYPNAGSLVVNFKAFALKIISIFEDRIKDKESKLIFEKMKEMSNITESKFVFFLKPTANNDFYKFQMVVASVSFTYYIASYNLRQKL